MKKNIRKEVLAKRNGLSIEEVQAHSQQICEQVLPFLKGTIGIYKAYGSEVDVSYLENSNTCAIPKTLQDRQLAFYKLNEQCSLKKSTLGIWEPVEGDVVIPNMLIIPLVAFDEHCNRLGHGAGYYDRYLAHFKGLKIGVAHECQKVDNVYEDDYDIALDFIVSEKQVYVRN